MWSRPDEQRAVFRPFSISPARALSRNIRNQVKSVEQRPLSVIRLPEFH